MSSNDIAVSVRGLSKEYQIAQNTMRTKTAQEALFETLKNPFRRAQSETFHALKDVSFDIQKGDVVGIIGRNGAGKSTLLKILSRITEPTSGKVSLYGRVGSLLEVGTGFHPELTGRENIFLNGAILGMSRREITKQFDAIVDFAGTEKFLDTPVKRYSSGMYVRLAFSVAAHLNPEILIVDEVLAVGDADFQKKCIGKMQDVSRQEGRTILFVSHQLEPIRKLCTRAILMEKGVVTLESSTKEVLQRYLGNGENSQSLYTIQRPTGEDLAGCAKSLSIEDAMGCPVSEIPVAQHWQIRVKFSINKPLEHFIIALTISNRFDYPLRTTWSFPQAILPGEYEAVFGEDNIVLEPGYYPLMLGLSENERDFHRVEKAGTLQIADFSSFDKETSHVRLTNCGVILNQLNVSIQSCGGQ